MQNGYMSNNPSYTFKEREHVYLLEDFQSEKKKCCRQRRINSPGLDFTSLNLQFGVWLTCVYLFLHRGRPSGGKVRHKRQALQDMARPLKQWLYKHRDNPYPTKTEKILLALGSQMTLVQVSPVCRS